MRMRDKMAISRGFDHGNFVNAYETTGTVKGVREHDTRTN